MRGELGRLGHALAGSPDAATYVRRLPGGRAATTHLIRVAGLGLLVVKRARMPADAGLIDEFALLGVARAVDFRTPEPVLLDASGTWSGGTALVMSAVPGRTRLWANAGPWLDELARGLAAVHATRLPDIAPPALYAPQAWQAARLTADGSAQRSPRARAALRSAIELLRDIEMSPPAAALIHGDYHPGNVCWQDASLAGIVDWAGARIGPPLSDVAFCSVDVAVLSDQSCADMFVSSYGRMSNFPLDDLARWQLLWAAHAMASGRHWIRSYAAHGLPVSVTAFRARLAAFTDNALARL
jgi:aminoglycoside phosphotransferase (APT) family kinase protein